MATTTITTTATSVSLQDLTPQGISQRHPPAPTSPAEDNDLDPILEASRVADSSVPDGGYGWVVVAGCAVMTWWYAGSSYAWGILQGAFVEQGLSSPATLAFIGSLSMTLLALLAPINSRILRKLGARNTCLLGVSFLGVANILSSFTVNNVGGLFFTGGVLPGLGMGLCFITASVTPAQYFNHKRGIANGIVTSGAGLGGGIISFALNALIRRLGTAWSYRIMGLVTLATGLPAAWLIKERSPIQSRSFVEWSLFKNPSFVLILCAGAVSTFPLLVPPFFLPLYAHSIGLSRSTGAGLLAGFNFSSAAGRILTGFLCDKMGALNTVFAAMLLSAVSMLALWPASTTLAPLALFSVINGAANGGFFASMPTVVGNVFGSQRVTVAMGMVVTSWSGGYLMGAPVAGYLLDAYGGTEKGLQAFRPAMFYAGSMSLAAAMLFGSMRIRASKSPRAKV